MSLIRAVFSGLLALGFVTVLAACETIEPMNDQPDQPGDFPQQEPSDPFDPNQDDQNEDPFDPMQEDDGFN